MGQIVKCDICGKIYNESHLSAHKRMAHGKREVSRPSKSEPASLETILSLYKQLPDEKKKELLKRLAASDQTKT